MRVVVDPHMAPLAEPVLICSQYFFDVIKANTEGRPPPPSPLAEGMEQIARVMERASVRSQLQAAGDRRDWAECSRLEEAMERLQRQKAADPEGSAAGEPPCEQF